RSVVWNDCIQFAVYMAGAIATVWIIVSHLSGGWSQLVEFGAASGRWRMFDFDLSLIKPGVTFWSGLLGGAFLSLATHGVDQMIVQRYLKSTRLNSSHLVISYAVFCLKKKKKNINIYLL